mgnify:CR=1 FL=1
MKKSIFKKTVVVAVAVLTLFGAASCKKDKTETAIDPRLKDIDGNIYDTIKIGTQVWMVQNLKTSKYNDGTPIPTGLSNAAWDSTRSGAYAIPNNDANNDSIYGKLYNWYAVNTGKLAPKGWHVPTDAEWTTLTTYLGGDNIAGLKMKAITLWVPYTGITNTNSSGFTALPAGYRNYNGTPTPIGINGYFWSSTDYTPAFAKHLYMNYNFSNASISTLDKTFGYSVRCIKD